jgi:hypothetical protein
MMAASTPEPSTTETRGYILIDSPDGSASWQELYTFLRKMEGRNAADPRPEYAAAISEVKEEIAFKKRLEARRRSSTP